MDRSPSRHINQPSENLLQRRARAVEAFKARVDTADMTRRARAAEERAFLESIGAASVFRECPDVESSHVRTPSHPHRDGR